MGCVKGMNLISTSSKPSTHPSASPKLELGTWNLLFLMSGAVTGSQPPKPRENQARESPFSMHTPQAHLRKTAPLQAHHPGRGCQKVVRVRESATDGGAEASNANIGGDFSPYLPSDT